MRDVIIEPADFRKQPVWRQAFRLTIDVYRLMGAFPSLERWDGLATLMRKSVSSMGAHIAEGCTHLGRPEGALFFQMALGCTSELLHHMLVAKELGYVTQEQLDRVDSQLGAVRHMLVVQLREFGADTLPDPSLSPALG